MRILKLFKRKKRRVKLSDRVVTYYYENKRLEVKRNDGSGYGAQGSNAYSMYQKELKKN